MKKYYSEILILSDIKFLKLTLDFIDFATKDIGFSEEEINRIHLAAEESLSNIIENAFAPDEDGTIKVICKSIPTGIEIIINEKGIPYDVTQLPEYNPDEDLENQATEGLGLFLIKNIMDEFEIKNLGIDGRTTHLIKHLSQSKISDIISHEDGESFDKNGKIQLRKNVKFTIRNIEDHEAVEVSKCIYKAYGYSYLSEHVYYPQRIVALNHSGHFITAVAVTEENEFAGSCALSIEDGAMVAELGQAVVKPEFRKQGCLGYLTEYLIEQAILRGLKGFFVQAVANHIFSQREANRTGMRDCSILLGYCPASMKFKKIDTAENERTTIIQSYKNIKNYDSKNIYPPNHHKNMIAQIYNNIGIDVNFLNSPKKINYQPNSIIKTKYLNIAISATIKIVETGHDLLTKLENELKNICLKKYEVIYLHLSLEKPENIHFIKEIEKMGFFFGGILPNDTIGDSIIFQYLNNIDVQIENLSLFSDFAKILADYIQECKINNPIKQLINTGEGEQLEFKSTLRWNLKSNKKDIAMEISVMKTLVAFLNSNGGTLLVGVEDDGNILGIENDNFKNEDKYLLHFSIMIQNYIGAECKNFITYELSEINQKSILQIECIESSNPVFLKDGIKEDFYIRSGPSSIKLNTRKAILYINEHFGKK